MEVMSYRIVLQGTAGSAGSDGENGQNGAPVSTSWVSRGLMASVIRDSHRANSNSFQSYSLFYFVRDPTVLLVKTVLKVNLDNK